MKIARLHKNDENGELISLAVFSLTIPTKLGYEVDALCSFTGQGEDERVIQPAREYWESKKTKNRFFLVPGFCENEKTWQKIDKDMLSKKPFSIKKLKGVHTVEKLMTTKDQADWTVEKIGELGIKSCAVISTPFHLLRTYTTTLASMLKAGIKIPIVPIAVTAAPGKIIPEGGIPAWDMIQGEVERIKTYQKKGDVISYEDFKQYIDWLWKQPIMKKALKNSVRNAKK